MSIYVFIHVSNMDVGLGEAVVAGFIVIIECSFQMRVHIFVSPLIYLSRLSHNYPKIMRASLFFSAAF